MRNLTILFVVVLFASCRQSSRLEQVLQLAGANCAELEKVLSHYSADPADSLKYRAAVFLIENMPYHYELHNEKLDTFRTYLQQNETNYGLLDNFINIHGNLPSQYNIKHDIHCIKAEYLIRNIEFSFKIWQNAPWGKYIAFDTFCEEILPYRVDNEPIEDWKEIYYHTFYPLIDSVAQECDFEKICTILCQEIQSDVWIFASKVYAPGLGAQTLLKTRFGSCKEMAEIIVYIMRSLGIPCGIDIIVQHVESSYKRHHWNYIRMPDGKMAFIESFYFNRDFFISGPDRRCGKIYRIQYALQKESLPAKHQGISLPKSLNSLLLQDVSAERFPNTHISINIEDIAVKKGDIIYLNAYNGTEWIPIAWTDESSQTAVFKYVEPDILYRLSAMTSDKKKRFITDPFPFTGKGVVIQKVDSVHLQNMKIMRKCRLNTRVNARRRYAVGGRFQGANRADYSDLSDLHVIADTATMLWTAVSVKHVGKYRHVRYLGADSSRNNMAEVQFFSEGVVLQGRITGTDGSNEDNLQRTKEKVFDNDPLTFFDAPFPSNSWVGLTFDSPQKIDSIRYIFRNDDNNIRSGDLYELFYWDKSQWNSLGQKNGDNSYVLVYDNCPSGALFLLRNHTRGREERPFTYENDKQVFW